MGIKEILENKGATLTKTFRKSRIEKGYMVSLKGYEKQVKATQHTKLFGAIADAREIAKTVKHSYVGVWIENDIAYVDVSIRVRELEVAINIGIENEQLAIFDIENEKVISLC